MLSCVGIVRIRTGLWLRIEVGRTGNGVDILEAARQWRVRSGFTIFSSKIFATQKFQASGLPPSVPYFLGLAAYIGTVVLLLCLSGLIALGYFREQYDVIGHSQHVVNLRC
jgi:hypothetical protein